jgi:alkylated DNA repair dioxygenase AlkB
VQQSLFAPTKGWEQFQLLDASVRIQRDFMTSQVARDYFSALLEETSFYQDKISMYGKTHLVPRMHRWFGDTEYSWSGVRMKPTPWTQTLRELRILAAGATGTPFNSALVNYYRNGDDTVGWHADDEPGIGATIASLSLGETRDFCMRHKGGKQKVTIPLNAGSLLVMSGRTQETWEHSLPRRRDVGPRINVTFRQMGQP